MQISIAPRHGKRTVTGIIDTDKANKLLCIIKSNLCCVPNLRFSTQLQKTFDKKLKFTSVISIHDTSYCTLAMSSSSNCTSFYFWSKENDERECVTVRLSRVLTNPTKIWFHIKRDGAYRSIFLLNQLIQENVSASLFTAAMSVEEIQEQ